MTHVCCSPSQNAEDKDLFEYALYRIRYDHDLERVQVSLRSKKLWGLRVMNGNTLGVRREPLLKPGTVRELLNDNALSRPFEVSTRILGRRTAPFAPFIISYRVSHGFTPRS